MTRDLTFLARGLAAALTGGLLMVLASPGWAQSCSFGSVPHGNFGPYNPAVALDVTFPFVVNCTAAVPNLQICLSPSSWTGGVLNRAAKHDSSNDRINYNMFKDAARTQIWGRNPTGSATCLTTNAAAGANLLYMYGRAPAGQSVPAGHYSDPLTIEVTP